MQGPEFDIPTRATESVRRQTDRQMHGHRESDGYFCFIFSRHGPVHSELVSNTVHGIGCPELHVLLLPAKLWGSRCLPSRHT